MKCAFDAVVFADTELDCGEAAVGWEKGEGVDGSKSVECFSNSDGADSAVRLFEGDEAAS